MTSNASPQGNADLIAKEQEYGTDPLKVRETGQYRSEYVKSFAEKWDELIDWDARAASEGDFFIDILRARGKHKVLDVAAGTGFHSVRLIQAGFDVTTVDGSAAMLAKAFENGKERQIILKTVQADWRWLNRDIQGKYDAIICLGNSFTHLHEEADRRRTLAEFYAALKHDGILIIDQRNYDAMLDHGFSTKHKFYYCGDQVTAEPAHLDDGLARFKYTFPDKSEYTLNMFPVRKAYMKKLLSEAGFQRIRTYGDFQETYAEGEPDFLVHVVEKSYLQRAAEGADGEPESDVELITEQYYDSADADNFYYNIWGGEDIHIGLYEETPVIKEASARTVRKMAGMLKNLTADTHIIDLGAGYGGSARHLAREYGCSVDCLNISEAQNDTNRFLNRRQALAEQIKVAHGSFDKIPAPNETYHVVWSQDSILHAKDREQVFAEAHRVLKPGGEMIITDPMQADNVPEGVLQPVYDRIHLENLGSPGYYREIAEKLGFELVEFADLTPNLRTHYARVGEDLRANYDHVAAISSKAFLDRMLQGLDNWVKAADSGYMAWGILHFRKR